MKKIFLILSIFVTFCFSANAADKKEGDMKMIYIVHGFGASPDSHWFIWLKEKLEANKNVHVKILNMPEPFNPSLDSWISTINKEATNLSSNTFFVGHSLGVISTLKFIEQKPDIEIGGAVLVSGFDKPLAILPILNKFTEKKLDYKVIKQKIKNIASITASDDEIVPSSLTRELAQNIGSEYIELKSGKHFLDSDGYTSFELVYEILENMIKQ
ncbi:MAG: RBBP9/YdeN family alpha/beta hydrolase [Campylobacteraceae bacterium]